MPRQRPPIQHKFVHVDTMLDSRQEEKITNWPQFAEKVRSQGSDLLGRLDEFPNSVLVTGCQRSGTTMLARIITESEGMTNYWFGPDDELDAALILAGVVPHRPRGRYCFQTTYLNERYHEYFQHTGEHRLIWVLRSPDSVIYSMLYNWKQYALEELFQACGVPFLSILEKARYKLLGAQGIPLIKQACLSYNGKTAQLFEIHERLTSQQLFVVDYDELVRDKDRLLHAVYSFIDLPYHPSYADKIRTSSLRKKERLSSREKAVVHSLCRPVYERARQLLPEQ